MRECGAAVPPSPLPGGRLRYDPAGAYLDAVSAALDAASGALLRLMLGQGQLMGWLRSIKHFFLLDQVRARAGRALAGLMPLSRSPRALDAPRLLATAALLLPRGTPYDL